MSLPYAGHPFLVIKMIEFQIRNLPSHELFEVYEHSNKHYLVLSRHEGRARSLLIEDLTVGNEIPGELSHIPSIRDYEEFGFSDSSYKDETFEFRCGDIVSIGSHGLAVVLAAMDTSMNFPYLAINHNGEEILLDEDGVPHTNSDVYAIKVGELEGIDWDENTKLYRRTQFVGSLVH